MIDVQNIPDQTFLRVISEGKDLNWEFFALKVMISRLKLKLSMTAHEEAPKRELTQQQCCKEMRDLFSKSRNIPNAKKDLQIIIELFDNGE